MHIAIICLLILIILLEAGGIATAAYIANKLRNKANSTLYAVQRAPDQLWEHLSLLNYVQPSRPLPPPGGWAASSDFLLHLLQVIDTCRPQVVVELGSGLSTVVTAYALKRMGGGKIISIDHDADYAQKTRELLANHDLENFASVRIAILKQQHLSGGLPWYDLAQLTGIKQIDLLVVDGPKYGIGHLARMPAVEVFMEKFSDRAIIMLDDADRAGERAIVQHWKSLLTGWSFESIPTEKGLTVITRKPAQPIEQDLSLSQVVASSSPALGIRKDAHLSRNGID